MELNDKFINTIEVDKSKFIAIAMPMHDAEVFKETYKALKKEYNKAKHIVYAYRIGQSSKSTDDGEPKGTAGHPLLEFLYKKDLNNIVIFVVRYFGGVKLGASRLLRTYLKAGIDVVNLALKGKE